MNLQFSFTESKADYPGLYFVADTKIIDNKKYYLVKIGKSDNGIKQRIKNYYTYNPLIFHNNYSYRIDNKQKRAQLEIICHNILSELSNGRVANVHEWFSVNKMVFNELIKNPWIILEGNNKYLDRLISLSKIEEENEEEYFYHRQEEQVKNLQNENEELKKEIAFLQSINKNYKEYLIKEQSISEAKTATINEQVTLLRKYSIYYDAGYKQIHFRGLKRLSLIFK